MPSEIGFPTLTSDASLNQNTNKKKLAMNNRRLLIALQLYFILYIQWEKTDKNITCCHKTLSASAAKVGNFQDAA